MTTPNDAARQPAQRYDFYADTCGYVVATPDSIGGYVTAADYDALRAEVERLLALEASLRGRAMAEHVRAEAAEAKIGRVEKLAYTLCRSHGVMSDMILAALNEGGE